MRSKQLDLTTYNSDKITYNLMEEYDRVFEPWVEKNVKLLELGIYRGESLLLWKDYFPMGDITGIDITLPPDFTPRERITLFEGSQTDKVFLSWVATKMAPEGFDIIIDDASHLGEFTKQSFWHLFDNHLKPGGVYVVEDWLTGYFDNWPDGKQIKTKQDFLSKMRSSLHTRINYFIKIPFIIERRLLGGTQRGKLFINKLLNLFIKRLFAVLLKVMNTINPASVRTGLLPPYNLLFKVPFHSHNYGMVGFIKQLIDEQGAGDLMRGKPSVNSKFSRMIITQKMVFIHKAADQP